MRRTDSALAKVIILLRPRPAMTSPCYKKNTLYRRIERRMSIHQIEKIADYVRYLQENPQELEILFKELLIGVTSFSATRRHGSNCGKKSSGTAHKHPQAGR